MEDKKKEFWTKLASFIGIGFITPTIYLAIRFNLFTSKHSISFWGCLVFVLFLFIVGVLIKYYLDGMKTKYSFAKQVLSGVVKVILPLVAVLVCIIFLKSKLEWLVENINLFIEAFSVIIACEIIAILVNPLPKWAFENNVEGLTEITDKILHKNEDTKEE